MGNAPLDPASDDQSLRSELLSQTGDVEWHEMEVHFARGMLIRIAPELDLTDVAMHMIRDRKELIEEWASNGQVLRATDEDARRWYESTPRFRAVVIAPWVLVQELDADAEK